MTTDNNELSQQEYRKIPFETPKAPPRYWFPPKRFGCGWGPPQTVEGWVFLLGMLAVFGLLQLQLIWITEYAVEISVTYTISTIVWVVVLLVVCYWKGDPRGMDWHWGDEV